MDRPPLHFSRLPLPQQQVHGLADNPPYPLLPSATYSPQSGPDRRDLPHSDPFFSRRPAFDQRVSSTIPHERAAPYEYSPTSRFPSISYPSSSNHGQLERRGSYGSIYSSTERRTELDGGDIQRREHENHTLPPPASDLGRAGQATFLDDHQRRSSFSNVSRPSQSQYGGQDRSPPPLPASFFGTRPMPPPPSSPQYQHSTKVQARQPGPPFPTQLPAISSLNRPGSSMSISSIIGIDSEPAREAQSTRSNGYSSTSFPAPYHSSDHPNVSHSIAESSRIRTPESVKAGMMENHGRAFSGGNSYGPYFAPSIDSSGTLLPLNSQVFSNTQSFQYGTVGKSALDERLNGHQRHASTSSGEHRPERNPDAQRTIAESEETLRQETPGLSILTSRRHDQTMSQDSRSAHQMNRQSTDKVDFDERDSRISQRAVHSTTSEAQDLKLSAGSVKYPFLFRQSHTPASQGERVAEERQHDRSADVPSRQAGTSSLNGGDPFRRFRDSPSAVAHGQSVPISAVLSQISRRASGHRSPSLTRRTHPHLSIDSLDPNHDSADESFRPRHLLSHLLENKTGRLSPLPQAVQGAQARLRGPSNDPGIKSEFSRMFSGIGSGSAASTPQPMETNPPPISSPDHGDEPLRNPLLGRADLTETKSRNSSRVGRRGRKTREDEDAIEDLDSQSLIRTNSGRGAKRSRQSYVHSTTSHHASLINDASRGNPHAFSTVLGKRTFTPTPGLHSSFEHPSLHTSYSQSISRRPKVTINNQAVFESMRHRKRSHLGSTVYAPVIRPAASKGREISSSLGYEITPVPIPRFHGMENCTLTVRVPRMFLERAEREEICKRRVLWGAEIYADDSDPVAVAIHSGWIRGEWTDDIDLSMLDLGISHGKREAEEEARRTKGVSIILTEPPAIPMLPVPNMDLHITLLILPSLVNYASLVCYGLKSRSWSSRHDGLSYKVDSIAWVDEKSRIGEERGGEARRKRLRAMDSAKAHKYPSFPASFLSRGLILPATATAR